MSVYYSIPTGRSFQDSVPVPTPPKPTTLKGSLPRTTDTSESTEFDYLLVALSY
jgi:hypothetical protein